MGLYNLKEIWKSSVYVTPNLPIISTKRYKVPLLRILSYIGIYTFALTVVVITVLTLTDAKNWIFFMEKNELQNQSKRIKVLEKQVLFLSNELKNVSSINRSLRYALILADSTTIDSTSSIYDSLKIQDVPYTEQEGHALSGLFNLMKLSYDFLVDEDTLEYFIKPVSTGIITGEFNPGKGHVGMDFGVKLGSPVFATAGGLIVFADYSVADGYKIIIQHSSEVITIYKHCSELLKKERDFVEQGELIALSGDSGYNTTGPHLHFEIWQNGKPINPRTVIVNLN